MLRSLLQDGAVLALVLDRFGQAGHGCLAVGPQGDLGQAARVDEDRDELRGEGVASLEGKLIAATAPVSLSTTTSVVANCSSASVTPALVLIKQ